MRISRTLATAGAAALLLTFAACGGGDDDASPSTTTAAPSTTAGEGTSTTTGKSTTTATTDKPATTTTSASKASDEKLCAAARKAAAAFAPSDSSKASFTAIGEAWAGLAATLPEPHAATAATLADTYTNAAPEWGADDSQPSKAYIEVLYAGTSAQFQQSVALATAVKDTCGVTLPGFG